MNNNDPRLVIFIIGVVVLVPAYFIIMGLESSKLKSEGKIIDRKHHFAKYTEVFILKAMPFEDICDAIVNTEYYGKAKAEGNTMMRFITIEGNNWLGEFSPVDLDEPIYNDGKLMQAYQFSFLQWTPGKSNSFDMNIALTALEKTLLHLDPMTQVAIKRNQVNTKTEF